MKLTQVVNTDGVVLSINTDLIKVILKNADGNAVFVFDPNYLIETNETYQTVIDTLGERAVLFVQDGEGV